MKCKAFPIALNTILGLACMAGELSAATITLAPSLQNTLIQDNDPNNQLSNGQGDIFVGRTNQDGQGPATVSIRRGLIEFNIAGNIPAGATITGVTLSMQDVQGLNGSQTISLHDALASWGQGNSFFNGGVGAPAQQNDATWLYRFYNATTPSASPTWTTPGGDFSSTVSGSTVVTTAFGQGHVFSWLGTSNPLMIADVQNWLNNPATNFGWVLTGNEAMGQTAKRFAGVNAATPPSDNLPPTLTISYTVPEPATMCLAVMAACGLVCFVPRSRRESHRS